MIIVNKLFFNLKEINVTEKYSIQIDCSISFISFNSG